MRIWFLLVIFISGFSDAQGQTDSVCSPLLKYCSYYTCVARELNCSPSNYLLSFGEKYCRKFESRENHFSLRGKKFLEKVGLCLRSEIENQFNGLTCRNVKSFASGSHVSCYVRSGFCKLSFSDKIKIMHTVLKPALFDPAFRKVASQLSHACH